MNIEPRKVMRKLPGGEKQESYYRDDENVYHRKDGPAFIQYYWNDKIKTEKYYANGKIHREDGPAEINYYENGKIKGIKYYENGKPHREDGPAIIKYDSNGTVTEQKYYIDGKEHNISGEAKNISGRRTTDKNIISEKCKGSFDEISQEFHIDQSEVFIFKKNDIHLCFSYEELRYINEVVKNPENRNTVVYSHLLDEEDFRDISAFMEKNTEI